MEQISNLNKENTIKTYKKNTSWDTNSRYNTHTKNTCRRHSPTHFILHWAFSFNKFCGLIKSYYIWSSCAFFLSSTED